MRAELGVRTIFNLLGPLCNPARVERQTDRRLFPRAAGATWPARCATLGSRRVWLLHGSDGLDEATTTGVTHVVALEDGAIRAFDITPEDAGLPRATAQELVGGDPAHNARALRAVLAGEKNAYRDIAVLNAGIALVVAERAGDIRARAPAMAARGARQRRGGGERSTALVTHSNA